MRHISVYEWPVVLPHGNRRRPAGTGADDPSGADNQRPDHAGFGVALHGAEDPVRPGRGGDEADPLGLTRPCPGVDIGDALDLPVMEDRVVVRELRDDDRAAADLNVGRGEADV